jgi:hypothetical protein
MFSFQKTNSISVIAHNNRDSSFKVCLLPHLIKYSVIIYKVINLNNSQSNVFAKYFKKLYFNPNNSYFLQFKAYLYYNY